MEEEFEEKNIFMNKKYILVAILFGILLVLLILTLLLKDYFTIKELKNRGLASFENIINSDLSIKKYEFNNEENSNKITEKFKIDNSYLEVENTNEKLSAITYSKDGDTYKKFSIYENKIGKYFIKNNNNDNNSDDDNIKDIMFKEIKSESNYLNIFEISTILLKKKDYSLKKVNNQYIIKMLDVKKYYNKESGLIEKIELYKDNECTSLISTTYYEYELNPKENLEEKYNEIYAQNIEGIIEFSNEEYYNIGNFSNIFDKSNKDNNAQIIENSNSIFTNLKNSNDPKKIDILVNNILYEKTNSKENLNKEKGIVFSQNCIDLINLSLDLLEKPEISDKDKIIVLDEIKRIDYSLLKDEALKSRLNNYEIN